MKKLLVKLSMLMILPVMLIGCSTKSGNDNKQSEKVNVMVSISPLKEFAERIGGDKIEVSTLVPENAEPHDIDFAAKRSRKANEKPSICIQWIRHGTLVREC